MSNQIIELSKNWTIDGLIDIIENKSNISLGSDCIEKIKINRTYLESKLKSGGIFYGINTGFGSLCNTIINDSELDLMQKNLVISHACGTGYMIDEKTSQLIFLLKIINLSKGHSGVRLTLVDHMIHIYNMGIYPVIYEQGSLGASGDLAPLAHLSLLLIGEGQCYYKGQINEVKDIFEKLHIDKLELKEKEGLALLNGTQFSLAHAVISLDKARRALNWSNKIAAASLHAFCGSLSPFHHLISDIRNNRDQSTIASIISEYCFDMKEMKKYSVQDPYSFRCIPQVHGASLTAINHVEMVIENELNAITDNPNIFHEEDMILSGGNFHAQSLALVMDYLSIAISEIASISERRIYQLINGDRELPPFLVDHSGLNSGFMIVQYTAASIVSQNKQLSTPTSVDSIVSSKGQEDHVSMAANGSTRCIKVSNNTLTVLAMELMVAMQACDYRDVSLFSTFVKNLHEDYRKYISFLDKDRILHVDIMNSLNYINRLK
ncbi:MAG: histidine ammonia-lyase [Bacteroidota bacterium]|jgi:histidine ammonia-lyase